MTPPLPPMCWFSLGFAAALFTRWVRNESGPGTVLGWMGALCIAVQWTLASVSIGALLRQLLP